MSDDRAFVTTMALVGIIALLIFGPIAAEVWL